MIIFYLCLSLALLSPPKWLDTELDLLGEVGLLDLDLWRPRGLPEATLSSDLEPGLCDMEDDLKNNQVKKISVIFIEKLENNQRTFLTALF